MVKLFSKNSNLCDHNSPTLQTDGRRDRQTTCDRNTALCTKVHRAVKIVLICCNFVPDNTSDNTPDYLHSFSRCCLSNLRNQARKFELTTIQGHPRSKAQTCRLCNFVLVVNNNFGRISYRFWILACEARK